MKSTLLRLAGAGFSRNCSTFKSVFRGFLEYLLVAVPLAACENILPEAQLKKEAKMYKTCCRQFLPLFDVDKSELGDTLLDTLFELNEFHKGIPIRFLMRCIQYMSAYSIIDSTKVSDFFNSGQSKLHKACQRVIDIKKERSNE